MEENIVKSIALWIVREVQEKASSFQYSILKEEVEEKFEVFLEEADILAIEDAIWARDEITDCEYWDDMFDVVLGTAHAPNYCSEDYEEWFKY